MTATNAPVRPSPIDEGPIGFTINVVLGAIVTILFSWSIAIVIELVGSTYFWPNRGLDHARDMVVEDLGYIAAAPHSVFVADTVPFAHQLLGWVASPFLHFDIPGYYRRSLATVSALDGGADSGAGPAASTTQAAGAQRSSARDVLRRTAANTQRFLASIALIALYTAQDAALRLAVVVFALPAFLLACLLGAVDGLVRRDLRKWGGGRESSFIYHHAKATVYLALGGGFSLYLAWPLGGFNPAYMVLAGTVMVAWSLSLTLSAFKKYL